MADENTSSVVQNFDKIRTMANSMDTIATEMEEQTSSLTNLESKVGDPQSGQSSTLFGAIANIKVDVPDDIAKETDLLEVGAKVAEYGSNIANDVTSVRETVEDNNQKLVSFATELTTIESLIGYTINEIDNV